MRLIKMSSHVDPVGGRHRNGLYNRIDPRRRDNGAHSGFGDQNQQSIGASPFLDETCGHNIVDRARPVYTPWYRNMALCRCLYGNRRYPDFGGGGLFFYNYLCEHWLQRRRNSAAMATCWCNRRYQRRSAARLVDSVFCDRRFKVAEVKLSFQWTLEIAC